MKRRPRLSLRAMVSLAALLAALLALGGALREARYREVERYVATLPGPTFAAAVILSILSVLASSSLDLVALRHLGRRVPAVPALAYSFVSTSASNLVAPALLTGGALRARLYAAVGLGAEEVGGLVVFGATGFWLGFLVLAAFVLALAPIPAPPSLGLPRASLAALGVACGAAVGIYLAACARGGRVLRVRNWEVRLPSLAVATTQTLVSAGDWTLAAAALWVLAPDLRGVPFPAFLSVYLAAQLAGLASHVPGGLGVFEAVVIRTLAPHAPASHVLGALAAYRAAYYVIPLALSLAAFAAIELRRLPAAEGLRAETARWLLPWVPAFHAIAIFVGGVVLLVSGATPAVSARMSWLRNVVPLPFIEGSHFLASVSGAALLLLARGLSRRLDAAYLLSALLLAAGAVFSLVKGLDYEEAALLAVMLLALLPARRHFYRRASIFHERFSPGWLAAVLLAVSGSIVVGLFAYRHVEYSSELWWQFTLVGHAPRFLRASVGAAGLVAAGAFFYLLRPAPRAPGRPSRADLDAVQGILARTPETQGWLALLADKALLWNAARTAFLMYGVRGRSWVALGDPVGGGEQERRELCWQFRELVDREGGRIAFYDVGPATLPFYVDMGLTLLKLGDEARVRLEDFTLEGGERKALRHVLHRIEREGGTFDVLPPGQADSVLGELRQVSDDWLASKRTREKGFSLGFYDPAYLLRCPVAVVRSACRVVAFSNLWTGAPGGELSIDLMRYAGDAPANVMDHLFTHLMLWGREHEYAWFNLGMAPLSGLTDHALAPVWNRIGTLLYRHGEDFYNFQGLRQYKAKYGPVWQPRYLACDGGLGVAGVLLDVAALNSRGLGGIVSR